MYRWSLRDGRGSLRTSRTTRLNRRRQPFLNLNPHFGGNVSHAATGGVNDSRLRSFHAGLISHVEVDASRAGPKVGPQIGQKVIRGNRHLGMNVSAHGPFGVTCSIAHTLEDSWRADSLPRHN